MTDAVHRHRPFVLDRNHGRELAVVLGADDLAALLEPFTFAPQVRVSGGEFVIRLPEFNLIAAGARYDDALAELVELSEQYVENYLDRLDFYMQTDRRSQLPWVMRIAVAPSDERSRLISPERDDEPAEVAQPA